MTAFSIQLAAAQTATARIGQVVGDRYQLLRLLGTGGMGTVYEARHVRMERRFAVKFLHADLAKKAEVLARFEREALAAGTLDTEHVVEITDFGVAEEGAPYLVMEYLSGEDLAQLLAREGSLAVPRAIKIALDVCRGLAVAHAAGIVHRDLKPANLFLARRADGSIVTKILDFGIAKLRSPTQGSVTLTGATLGTPYYMAPEQVRDTKEVDQRVDLYALGVVLYELLSGHKPHPGEGYHAIVAHLLTEPPAPLDSLCDGLSPELVRVVHRTMAKNPADRPQTAAELAHELSAFAGREILQIDSQLELRNQDSMTRPETADVSESALPIEAWLKRSGPSQHPLGVALMAGGLLLVGGGVGWQLGRASSTPDAPQPPALNAARVIAAIHSTPPMSMIEVVPSDASARAPALPRQLRERALTTAFPRLSGTVAGRPRHGPDTERTDETQTDPLPSPGRWRVPIDPRNPYE
jgi:serine/threonine-protein kinase